MADRYFRDGPRSLEVDVRLAVMEYADVAAEYAAVVGDPRVPLSALEDYALVVDILALARRAPTAEIPSLLSIGTRALLRVHRALPGAEETAEEAEAA
ncbi:hypothetical protein SRB5_40780 [Streptomyces sp. RB5]|uniref:Uncharacterized protein n=1 Tax=Streptomyces smaragdinus TaxID=2585196 RepID=A0A7K0CK91_9ACTN|nr:hypothetical protein [Streptomyces smaragdinus]MQY13920.1 hypothetical protein [Streptomyces smaragdinus]